MAHEGPETTAINIMQHQFHVSCNMLLLHSVWRWVLEVSHAVSVVQRYGYIYSCPSVLLHLLSRHTVISVSV